MKEGNMKEVIKIEGGHELNGEVTISGSKMRQLH